MIAKRATERFVSGVFVQNVFAEIVLVYACHVANWTLPFIDLKCI
jgi:hypothetical protein